MKKLTDSMNMRHYPVGNYEIFYEVDNENTIVTVDELTVKQNVLNFIRTEN